MIRTGGGGGVQIGLTEYVVRTSICLSIRPSTFSNVFEKKKCAFVLSLFCMYLNISVTFVVR